MAKANSTLKDKHKNDDVLIKGALKALRRQLKKPKSDPFSHPEMVKSFLQLELGREDREVFCVMYLDAQNRLIEFERLTKGTLMQTSVYPREVARSALKHNAAAVILAHNHPTGEAQESKADRMLTETLRESLGMFEVMVLDHIIIAGNDAKSFSEHGLI
jgi:DNA repair protein RadC